MPYAPATSGVDETDAAGRFNAQFNDPSKWKVLQGIPVFDEHAEQSEVEEPGPDGKPIKRNVVERFDRASLERHAANCNALVERGNPPGLTIGHTRDDGPETSQPETIGFGRNYRVAYSPTLQRLVVLHDEYIRPDKYEEAKSYPYRSVERWRGGEYFKPVAMLRREPRRNLGIVTYHAANGDTVSRYSMEAPSMPDPMAPPMTGIGTTNVQPPNAAQGSPVDESMMEPSDKDKMIHKKLMEAYFADPANCEQMKKYMSGGAAAPPMTSTGPENAEGAGLGEPPVPEMPKVKPPADAPSPDKPAPEKNAAGMPSGSNTAMPTLPETQMNAANTVDVVRYQADLKARDDRIAALERESRIERYSAHLDKLARENGVIFDKAEELTAIQDYGTDRANQHFAHMLKRYEKRPVGRIRTGEGEEVTRGNAGGQERMTREGMNKALQYQADHPGSPWRECVEKSGGKVAERPQRNGETSRLYDGR